MMVGRLLTFAGFVMIATVSAAAAGQIQEPIPFVPELPSPAEPPHSYIQTGFGIGFQGAGVPNHRVSPGVSGMAADLSVAAGRFFSPQIAVEGQVSFGTSFKTSQHFSYTWREDYSAESRDVVFTTNVRLHSGGRRSIEIVAGGGVAYSTIAERSIIRTQFGSPASTPPDMVGHSLQPMLGAGVAVTLPLN